MTCCCEIHLKDIKKKSKFSHLKSKSRKKLEENKHILLSLKNVDLKVVDEIICSYIKGHKKIKSLSFES